MKQRKKITHFETKKMSDTKKRTKFRISDWMSISFPRSEQNCICCNQKIEKVGIIIYQNHERYKEYAWIHMQCLKTIMPSKLKSLMFWTSRLDDTPIYSTKYGCSFCGIKGRELPILSFGYFHLHMKCILNAYNVAYGIFLDNEKELLAKMI